LLATGGSLTAVTTCWMPSVTVEKAVLPPVVEVSATAPSVPEV